MENPLTIEVTHQPGIVIVKMIGEIRLQTRSLEMELMRLSAVHPPAVILDMADVGLVSSLGMGLFVSLRNGLRRHNSRLLAAAFQPLVLDSFQRARLETIFEVFPSLDAAIASAQKKID